MHELHYTSAPSGLKTGTSGYTVVGRTQGIGRTLSDIAEGLSSYEFLNKTNPRAFASEPINWIHLTGQGVHIVSRITACAPDHSQRSNYLAHHLLLDPSELAKCPAGPAELLATPHVMKTEWTGEPREFSPRQLPALANVLASTAGVVEAGLDPGWSESLANRLRDPSVAETWLVYPRGMNMLELLRSVLSQLSPEERWAATFTTCASRNFPGRAFPARIKCVVDESDYAKEVLAKPNAFDLGAKPSPPAQRKIVAPARPTPAATPASVKAPGRIASAGPASISTRPVEPSPFDGWNMTTPDPIKIASPPSIEGPKWHHPWFLLPSLYSVGMTALCLWAVYLRVQATQELDSTFRKLEATRKDLADKDDAFQQLDDRTKSSIKQLQDKIKSLQTPAPRVAETAAATPAPASQPEPKKEQPAKPNPSSPTGKDSKPAEPSAKPKLVYKKPLDELPSGKDHALVEGLTSPLENDALSLEGPDDKVLESELNPKDKGWGLSIGKKLAFDISYDDGKLMARNLGSGSPPFHRYFTLSIRVPGSQPFKLPLGSPLDFKLDVKPAGGKGSDGRWRLFGDDKQTREFLRGIPNTKQDLHNVLEFDKNSTPQFFYAVDSFHNNSPAIGLGDGETNAGVVISMPNDEKLDCEIVALIGDLSKQGTTWRTPEWLQTVTDAENRKANMKPRQGAPDDEKKLHSETVTKARDSVKVLTERRDAAINVLKTLKDAPVRWKLCPLKVPGDPSKGVDESKGLVIIDSLTDPKSDR